MSGWTSYRLNIISIGEMFILINHFIMVSIKSTYGFDIIKYLGGCIMHKLGPVPL